MAWSLSALIWKLFTQFLLHLFFPIPLLNANHDWITFMSFLYINFLESFLLLLLLNFSYFTNKWISTIPKTHNWEVVACWRGENNSSGIIRPCLRIKSVIYFCIGGSAQRIPTPRRVWQCLFNWINVNHLFSTTRESRRTMEKRSWVLIPILPLICHVISNNAFNLSGLQFFIL